MTFFLVASFSGTFIGSSFIASFLGSGTFLASLGFIVLVKGHMEDGLASTNKTEKGKGYQWCVSKYVYIRDPFFRNVPFSTNHNVQVGAKVGTNQTEDRSHDKGDQGLVTTKGTDSFVAQPKVFKGATFGADNDTRDQDGGHTKQDPHKGSQFGGSFQDTAILLLQAAKDGKDCRGTDNVGHQEEANDIILVTGHLDGRNVNGNDENAGDPSRVPAELENVVGKDGAQSVLQRVDTGSRQGRDQEQGDNVPSFTEGSQQVKKGQEGELFKVIIRLRIVGVGNHTHDTKEHHEEKDHDTSQHETTSHDDFVLGRPDTLPGALVEQFGTGNGQNQGQSGLGSFTGPVGGLVPFAARNVVFVLNTHGNGEENDQESHNDALELVRDDTGGETSNGCVEDGKDAQGDRDTNSVLFGRVGRQQGVDSTDGGQFCHQVNEHVESANGGNGQLHETSKAFASEIRSRKGAVGTNGVIADHGTQPKANENGRKGRGPAVANDSQPTQFRVGSLFGGPVEDPSAHSGSKETQGNGPDSGRVTRGQEIVGTRRGVFRLVEGEPLINLFRQAVKVTSGTNGQESKETQDRVENSVGSALGNVEIHGDDGRETNGWLLLKRECTKLDSRIHSEQFMISFGC